MIRDYLTSHGASCLIGKGDGRRGGDYHYTDASMAVSYTHLDVYKRQVRRCFIISGSIWGMQMQSPG